MKFIYTLLLKRFVMIFPERNDPVRVILKLEQTRVGESDIHTHYGQPFGKKMQCIKRICFLSGLNLLVNF